MKIHTAFIASLFLFSACDSAEKKTTEVQTEVKETVEEIVEEVQAPDKVITVQLSQLGNSKMTGTVTFEETQGNVLMKAEFANVTQGKHAIHLHETGDCSSADGKSAGGHWNPTNEAHGKWGVTPFHRGDIGNFEGDNNGNATMSLETELWCIGCGDSNRDILGTAIIVHAGEDDCTSQPSGAAGARIACGVVQAP